MDKELFLEEVTKAATAYAEEIVCQPGFHRDAVLQDFMEGALTAYDVLNKPE